MLTLLVNCIFLCYRLVPIGKYYIISKLWNKPFIKYTEVPFSPSPYKSLKVIYTIEKNQQPIFVLIEKIKNASFSWR